LEISISPLLSNFLFDFEIETFNLGYKLRFLSPFEMEVFCETSDSNFFFIIPLFIFFSKISERSTLKKFLLHPFLNFSGQKFFFQKLFSQFAE